MNQKFNFNYLLIAIAIIVSVFILGAAYKYKFKSSETIVVTGLAEQEFTSDFIVWSGNFSRTDFDLKTVYTSLKENEQKVKQYLEQKGVPTNAIVFSAVDIQKNFKEKYDVNGKVTGSEFSGYTLIEKVKVESKDIERIEKLSREITELLQQGIEFSSNAPSYYYTKLNELKIDLLAKASADAKLRGETIAKNSGSSISGIRKATMGVFQITGKNDNENYSSGGAFNTGSKQKTASITLKVEYQVN
ncbi:MAG TPA: SIMPL domain-containing protein [Sediminibacterium sp.]|nr:SIMPL domain-containing protein [Sediminibacterium sp.]